MRHRSPRLAWALGVVGLGALAACGGGSESGAAFGLFAPAEGVDLPAGARPDAILVAHLDFDGKLDVVLTDRGNDTLIVLAGNGDGTLGFPFEYALDPGADPSALALGDVDLDGRPDVAVATRGGDDLVLWKGTGGSLFTDSTFGFPLPPGADPSGVAIADFDDDGRPDVAVANAGTSNVTVGLGLGDATFDLPVASWSVGGGSRPTAVVTADFDRDGRADVATSSGVDGTVSILLGVGDGTFAPSVAVTVDAGAVLKGLVVLDANRDGKADLAVADRTANTAVVLLGNGDGTFAAPVAFAAGPGPSGLTAADVDHDGSVDLVVAITGTGSASLLLGHGDGTFEPGFLFGTAGTGTRSVAVGDLDADGDRDVVVADETSGTVGILLQR